MVGRYEDSAGVEHSLVDYNGTFTTIDAPGATGTLVAGDLPGAVGTYVTGINGSGVQVGRSFEIHHFSKADISISRSVPV